MATGQPRVEAMRAEALATIILTRHAVNEILRRVVEWDKARDCPTAAIGARTNAG